VELHIAAALKAFGAAFWKERTFVLARASAISAIVAVAVSLLNHLQ
jgi:hypothetical protein